MEARDIINEFIKIFYISLISYLTYTKITDYKDIYTKTEIIIVTECAGIAILYVILIQYLYPVGAVVISYLLFGMSMKILLKNKANNFTISFLISLIITYIIYIISIVVAGLVLKLLIPNITSKSYLGLVTIIIIQTLLMLTIFRMKRLKKGFNFLKNKNVSRNRLVFTTLVSGLTLLVFGLFQRTNTQELNTLLFTGSILITISLIIWTQNQITKQYKRNMRDRTIEIQKKEIDEQLKIIKEVQEENLKLAKVIHKYNSRLSALELGIKNSIEQNNKTEFADELSAILEETQETHKNFSEETTINNNKLPVTNIIGIDNIFKYFQREANQKDIKLDLIINESINPLLEIIEKSKLEILIGDHLKDAIIAVNECKNSYKSILAILGVTEDYYEFSVSDTGIEFEIDTLVKLGLEQISTHKDSGGSGIGFMTTFETLKETKASLIIEEYNPNTTNYTKSVIIRFDGKSEYRICSYRSDEIKKRNKTKRIIVEEL